MGLRITLVSGTTTEKILNAWAVPVREQDKPRPQSFIFKTIRFIPNDSLSPPAGTFWTIYGGDCIHVTASQTALYMNEIGEPYGTVSDYIINIASDVATQGTALVKIGVGATWSTPLLSFPKLVPSGYNLNFIGGIGARATIFVREDVL